MKFFMARLGPQRTAFKTFACGQCVAALGAAPFGSVNAVGDSPDDDGGFFTDLWTGFIKPTVNTAVDAAKKRAQGEITNVLNPGTPSVNTPGTVSTSAGGSGVANKQSALLTDKTLALVAIGAALFLFARSRK